MEQSKTKKYKLWYRIFLVVGLFGLLDIIVGVLIKNIGFNIIGDLGLTSMISYSFLFLFGTKVATNILPFIMWISSTWFIWLGVSAVLRRKIKKLEKETGTVDKVGTKSTV